MQIDSIKYPVHSLGPGKRLVIWTTGCPRKCKNCITPRLQSPNPEMDVNTNEQYLEIVKKLNGEKIEGITISGGDPFFQKNELLKFIELLKNLTDDILIYTGYTYEEIVNMLSKNEIDYLKNNIAVLIDGPYIDELNDNKSVLRGSTNQNIYIFNNKYKKKYDNYLSQERKQELFKEKNGIRIVGIQNKEATNG